MYLFTGRMELYLLVQGRERSRVSLGGLLAGAGVGVHANDILIGTSVGNIGIGDRVNGLAVLDRIDGGTGAGMGAACHAEHEQGNGEGVLERNHCEKALRAKIRG